MTPGSGNIYFCGMIGSGKTTIGGRLAEELGLPFHDLDREMDRILGYSFHQLVKEKGWVAFRELEYSICKGFARQHRSMVCLGGGTVRYEWNMDVLKGTGLIILLTASLDELARRVRRADRPRVNLGVSLEEDLRKIWSESADKYQAAADIVYNTDHKTIAEAAAELKPRIVDYLAVR
ncbi:MAG: shikimate kinase [Thermodesulfobacteriota bacterium]